MTSEQEPPQPVGEAVGDWQPAGPPAPTVLEGATVTLEPLAAGHAEPLFEALCGPGDATLWTYRPVDPPRDVAGMARMVAALASDPDSVTFAVVPRDGTAAGLATYSGVRPTHGVLEVSGVLFGRRLQRTRPATEAVHLLLRHAFDELGYRRVEWKCDRLNEPSRRAALRLGFVHEGRFRRHMVVKGRTRDTDWFAVTDDTWPRVRAAQEQWLSPDNFDAEGRQRSSLADLVDALPPVPGWDG